MYSSVLLKSLFPFPKIRMEINRMLPGNRGTQTWIRVHSEAYVWMQMDGNIARRGGEGNRDAERKAG